MKKQTVLFAVLMLMFTGNSFAEVNSLKLMRDVINSKEFENLAADEAAKGFPLLNGIVVTNEADCPCYTVRATFQKMEAWPTTNTKNTDVVFFKGGSTL